MTEHEKQELRIKAAREGAFTHGLIQGYSAAQKGLSLPAILEQLGWEAVPDEIQE